MRVLLVEDDVSLSRFIEKGLKEAGHQVEVTDNGKVALSLSLTESYDVAIVDRMLPGLDGLSLVKALRAAQVGTPILFLTALGGVDDRVEALRPGAMTISPNRSRFLNCWRVLRRFPAAQCSNLPKPTHN